MKKRVLSIILVLVLLLAMTGCSSEKDALIGSWKCEMDLAEQLNAELAADPEIGPYLTLNEFKVVLYMEMKEDDTYAIKLDADVLNASMENLMDQLADGVSLYMEDLFFEETGMEMTVDEILALTGMTMEDLMAEFATDDIVEQMISESEREGKFDAKDGKLFTSAGLEYNVDPEVYETYTLEDGVLTLLEYHGDDSASEMNVYPMVFTKMN